MWVSMVNVDLVSSVDLVYSRTRHAILSGDFPPGSALRLQDLASKNGVSMIPVREALRLLEAEGFVESIPNRGARVAPLSQEDMEDVYRVRLVLEVEALRRAIPNLTPEILADARALNDEVRTLGIADDPRTQVVHRSLHFRLYGQSNSRWLLRIAGIVWDHTERYRRVMTPRVDFHESHRQHEGIINALANNDEPGALAALNHHLEQSRDVLRGIFTDQGPPRALPTLGPNGR
jgi:DNA-binding GntR family transcriptional regulator